MSKQLFTNWKGNGVSFVASKIVALIADKNKEETMVFVDGQNDAFYCSENYELLSKKLDICLSRIEKKESK
jgi:hypothetical protein